MKYKYKCELCGKRSCEIDQYLCDSCQKQADAEIWNAAVHATVEALLEAGNIDEHYRPEWTETMNKVLRSCKI